MQQKEVGVNRVKSVKAKLPKRETKTNKNEKTKNKNKTKKTNK